jgi:hypothetical protein
MVSRKVRSIDHSPLTTAAAVIAAPASSNYINAYIDHSTLTINDSFVVYSLPNFYKAMFDNYRFTAAERFLRYIQIDTQSDPLSKSNPSTEKQKDLGGLLAEELKQIGLSDAHMDEWGYVYATIPSNSNKNVPVICFCAHVDTAPDCSGTDVKPIVHKNYQGQDIILPDDSSQVLRIEDYPYLKTQIGNDIIIGQ